MPAPQSRALKLLGPLSILKNVQNSLDVERGIFTMRGYTKIWITLCCTMHIKDPATTTMTRTATATAKTTAIEGHYHCIAIKWIVMKTFNLKIKIN